LQPSRKRRRQLIYVWAEICSCSAIIGEEIQFLPGTVVCIFKGGIP
jgi:hypoxanthine phosphoribosyltransferase